MCRASCTAFTLLIGAAMSIAGGVHAEEGLPKKWNAWLEGRFYGIDDRVADQRSTGRNVSVGLDAKAIDWLTLGLGVSYETFDTRSGPQNLPTISNGVGVNPYAVVRLSDSLHLTGFGGVSHIDYDANFVPGQRAFFDAWRWLAGASLTGTLSEGSWRFLPTVTVIYGEENQRAYTTSLGAFVGPRQIDFGRITVGSEVAYTFRDAAQTWALEPFIGVRGNFDYIPNSLAVFNAGNFVAVSRGQWSAALAAGAALNTKQGFFARVQASHESLGMNGLDIWMAQARAGWNF